MVKDDPTSAFDEIDLGAIAKILHAAHPQYTHCEFVKMLTEIAPMAKCICSLCIPTQFPICQCKTTSTEPL